MNQIFSKCEKQKKIKNQKFTWPLYDVILKLTQGFTYLKKQLIHGYIICRGKLLRFFCPNINNICLALSLTWNIIKYWSHGPDDVICQSPGIFADSPQKCWRQQKIVTSCRFLRCYFFKEVFANIHAKQFLIWGSLSLFLWLGVYLRIMG